MSLHGSVDAKWISCIHPGLRHATNNWEWPNNVPACLWVLLTILRKQTTLFIVELIGLQMLGSRIRFANWVADTADVSVNLVRKCT